MVVHDVVRQGGQVREDTFDGYAQDADGNVWYLGEDTKEYENGKPKTREGSWEAGVDGASAGSSSPRIPSPDSPTARSNYKDHAEDGAEVLSLNAHAEVPYGTFDHAFQTRNFSPLGPTWSRRSLTSPGSESCLGRESDAAAARLEDEHAAVVSYLDRFHPLRDPWSREDTADSPVHF